jgi:hypothetical protein
MILGNTIADSSERSENDHVGSPPFEGGGKGAIGVGKEDEEKSRIRRPG